MFLVKGGEDLRNDERIELLFDLMNSVVASSSSSTSSTSSSSSSSLISGGNGRSLRARTYTVIPMTSEVGILEWVGNTIPIKAVVSQEMALDNQFCAKNRDFAGSKELSQSDAFSIRYDWVKGNDIPSYHKMFRDASEKNAVAVCKQVDDLLPDDFLRRRILKTSVGPESFITLRTEFAKTLAVSSLFGYILGLGDRHLENLLMDTQTGAILQIDFGCCFGMGQSTLGVPEFIPFRLSPQLRAVLRPLNGTGLLRHYMVQTMSCLRQEEGLQILTNALQVFINDPLVDWVGGLGEPDAEPKRRVESCLRKLRGVDPATIMIEDLSLNPHVRREKSLSQLSSMVRNACHLNVKDMEISDSTACRPDMGGMDETEEEGEILSVENQVDSVIALAVDPNIVIRQWVGLAAWI